MNSPLQEDTKKESLYYFLTFDRIDFSNLEIFNFPALVLKIADERLEHREQPGTGSSSGFELEYQCLKVWLDGRDYLYLTDVLAGGLDEGFQQ